MLKSIHHIQVTIPQENEAEARHFYLDVLGLLEIPKPKALAHKGGFWTKLDGIQLHISIQNGSFDRRALNSHICFEVSDLEKWKAKLSSHHIELEPNEKIPEGERIMLRDQSGNRLELLERAPPPMKKPHLTQD